MPTGANLEVDATIVLTVGSDCAIGKKTVAVELDLEARGAGSGRCSSRPGQTGIAIAGWGIAVDAVVADFLAGAAEWLVVEGARTWRQAPVRRGAGLARAPDVLGSDARPRPRERAARLRALPPAGATEIEGCPGHPIPPLSELIELHERVALPARKAKVACIALNTARDRERGRRPSARSPRSRTRPVSPPTTPSASARTSCLTRSSPGSRLPSRRGQRGARHG